METYFLYRHIRLDKNEPFYIGIGKKPKKFISLKNEYKRAYQISKRSEFWKKVYLKTDYKVDILFEIDSKEEIFKKETEFIKLYGRKDLKTGSLVNLTDGGDGCINVIYTEERKKKVSLANTGKKRTQEEKEKMSKIRLNDKVAMEKLSILQKTPKSKEVISKISESVKNYFNLPGVREKHSLAKKNISQETRNKMALSNTRRKQVIDENGKIYNSLSEYASLHYLDRANFSKKFNKGKYPNLRLL